VKRGDVAIVVIQGDYGKPRPGVVVQADLLNPTHPSVLVCPCTTDLVPGDAVRPVVEPTPANGLRARSKLMVDKLTVVPRAKVKEVVGHLEPDDLARLNWALMLVLGLP
jgi:mRNA interferase MazF